MYLQCIFISHTNFIKQTTNNFHSENFGIHKYIDSGNYIIIFNNEYSIIRKYICPPDVQIEIIF